MSAAELKQSFVTQARYNRWMNRRLYAVCARLSDEARKSDMGAFFGSVHGTLNHLLLGDRLWMGRFTGEEVRFRSLDQKLYADFDTLRREREITDQAILQWIQGLGPHRLGGRIEYLSMVDGDKRAFMLRDAVLHLFHHQTHHRGQLTTLLSQMDIDFGETDLIWMPGVEIGP